MKLQILLLAAAPLAAAHAQSGWVVEQATNFKNKLTYVIGDSTVRRTIWQNNVLATETFVDFRAGSVVEIDYQRKTIARTTIAGLLELESREGRFQYKAGGTGTGAGLPCTDFSFSHKSGRAVAGNGCFTKSINMAGPYERQFQTWLWENGDSSIGFELWSRESGRGGPRETQTVSAVRRDIAANEFLIPAAARGFQSIPYPRLGE